MRFRAFRLVEQTEQKYKIVTFASVLNFFEKTSESIVRLLL